MNEQVTNPETGSEPQVSPEERFEALLDAEDSQEQPEAEDKADYEEAVAATEDEVTEYTNSENDDVEVEETVEEDTEESEEDEPEVESVTHYKVKANGEEREVTVDELIKSYQLGQDYTKKTQEIAEQRKKLEAESEEVSKSLQLRDVYAQRLKQVEQLLMKENEDVDLDSLKENDPIGYAVKVAEATENNKKLEAIRYEQAQIAQQQEAQRQQALAEFVEAESKKVSEIIPEFSDSKKGEQVKNDIRSFGKSIGFSDDELGQVYDSRHVNVLYKAMKYDRLMKNKAGATKKVAEAPKMVKSKAKVQSTTSQAYRNQRKALRETGDSNVAVSVFESILNS